MKKITSNFKKIFLSVLLFSAIIQLFSQNNTPAIDAKGGWTDKNPLEQKVFIKNEGQFNNSLTDQQVYYFASCQGVKVYFTNSGLTYSYNKRVLLSEEELENREIIEGRAELKENDKTANAEQERERGRENKTKSVRQYLALEWVGSDKNVKIIAENQVGHYYTYSSGCSEDKKTSIKALAFRKLIYKNLYPNIDLEYIIPQDSSGIKYSFMIHPGGDFSQIQMKYIGELSINLNTKQELEIKSSFGLFTDHAPIAYYADNHEKVNAAFKINNHKTVGFIMNILTEKIPRVSNRTIILDPWSTTPSLANNQAFDINYDIQGNVYVAGGLQEVAKFNSTGTLQWIFSLPSGNYTDFAVDEQTSDVYMFDFTAFTQIDIYRIDASGNQSALGTAPLSSFEIWRAEFDRCNNQIIVASGNAAGGSQAFTVDKNNLSNVVPKNVLNEPEGCHDMALLAIDDDGSSCYMLATESVCGNPSLHNNEIVKCPLPNLAPSSLSINSGFTFREVFYQIPHYTPPSLGGTSHGFNGMKVKGCYLYGYDGNTIKIWDKSNGALIQTITVGGNLFDSGGLDVDDCGNIYAGNGDQIKIYNANYSLINTLNVNGTIYDMRLGPNNNLYACGDGFVQKIDLSGNIIKLNTTLIDAACDGCNGSANAQLICNNVVSSSNCIKYLWSTGATTPTVSNLCQGVYTVSVKAGCGTTYLDTINILSGIPPNVIASVNDTICPGQSASISVSGALTYKWTPGITLNDSTIASPIASPIVTTKYIVSGYNAGGCAGKDTVTIFVNSQLNLTKTVINATCFGACDGQTSVIPDGGTAPYTYNWTGGCTTASCNSLCPGSYTITVVDAFGCSTTEDTIITEPTALVASISNSTPTSCNNVCDGIATAIATGGTQGTGFTYSWNTVPVQSTAMATGLCGAEYICTVTDANNCQDTATVSIFQPPPVIIAPIANIIICTNDSATLVASASGGNPGGYTYSWDVEGNAGFATTPGITVNPTSTTNYTVHASDVGHSCPAVPVTVSVTVNPSLTVIANGSSGVCPGASVPLTAIATGGNGGAFTYSWTPATGLNSTSGTSVVANPAVTTTYTVTASDNCGTNAASVTVTIFPLPVLDFSVNVNQGCEPLCVNFSDGSSVNGGTIVSWNWNFGDGGSNSSTQNPSNCFTIPGKYSITSTVTSNNGCVSTFTNIQMITVFSNPVAAFNPTPNPATVLDPGITMKNQSSSDVNYWHWNFGDGDTLASTVSSPVHTYPNVATGSYIATLIVHNAEGCYDTVTHEIFIGPEFTFFIPNAFSPNGDNINDYFFGSGIGIMDYDLFVFDRWGNGIFHGRKLNDSWDGKANDGTEMAQQDVYIWKVKLNDVFGKQHNYIGSVTIVK